MLTMKKQVRLHNRFDIVVRDAKTGAIKQRAYAENIVLDALWAKLLTTSPTYNVAIHIGTGSGTLSAARTSLFTFLAGITAASHTAVRNRADGWYSNRSQVTITETQYVGSVLSEIGVASGTGSSTLMTHATLKDMNGNPVTIEKKNLDIITFYATVYARYEAAGWDSGHVVVFDDTILKYAVGRGDHALIVEIGPKRIVNAISGNTYAGVQISGTKTLSVANKTMTIYARVPAADANAVLGGIKGALCYGCAFDLMGSTAFPGSSIIGEQIGVGNGAAVDFKTAFGMVLAGAAVYLDGVEQTTGVTVDIGLPTTDDLAPYCREIENTASCFIGYTSTNAAPGIVIWENPFYATLGINTITVGTSSRNIYTSDDAVTWALAIAGANTLTIPAGHRNKRYWKYEGTTYASQVLRYLISSDLASTVYNVHFDTAPTTGQVITIDYDTQVVAKDANHVFDVTFEFQFGEYTP